MNTNPIVPENDPARMSGGQAAPLVHKPTTVDRVTVRGLDYAVRRGGPAAAPQGFLVHGWLDC
jgi:hypothetical protein